MCCPLGRGMNRIGIGSRMYYDVDRVDALISGEVEGCGPADMASPTSLPVQQCDSLIHSRGPVKTAIRPDHQRLKNKKNKK